MNHPKTLTRNSIPIDRLAPGRWPPRHRIVMLLPAMTLLGLLLAFAPLSRPGQLLLAATLGLLLGWGIRLAREALHPEQAAYRHLSNVFSRLARDISGPDILLDRSMLALYRTLQPRHLTLWRFDDSTGTLHLLRVQGHPPPDDLAELPVDLQGEQLHGIWRVAELPESALRQGLQTVGAGWLVSLSLGQELVGFVGLGTGPFEAWANRRALLELVGGQAAVLTKNALLNTELTAISQNMHLAYRRAIDAQDEERRHLATELHDDILGRLTTMALSLRKSRNQLTAAPREVDGWLQNLELETVDVNQRLREITRGLHPSVLTDLGLISALQAYMDSLGRLPPSPDGTHLITLTAQGFGFDRIANRKMERDVYYITRQALDNALKHAHAERIFIHLRWGEQAISVTVRDTGAGMASPPETMMGHDGHIGLVSMQERVLAWGGQLAIHTAPGQGATIRARLPIDQRSGQPAHLQAFSQRMN
jgi:signal transduction histidine kinase